MTRTTKPKRTTPPSRAERALYPPTRIPGQLPGELTSKQLALKVGVSLWAVLPRHRRHPERMPGRYLPASEAGIAGRGAWLWRSDCVRMWREDRAAYQTARALKRAYLAAVPKRKARG
jgi:hypothetical protein